MSNKKDKITLKETFTIHHRTWMEIRRYCPGIFTVVLLHSLLSAIGPYIGIYFSAQILNELAGLKRPDVLWDLVTITIISTAIMGILTGIALKLQNEMEAKYKIRKQGIFGDKMRSMDFEDMDKSKTHELLSKIRQSEDWSGWGINQLFHQFKYLTQSTFGILGAIVLTTSLFTSWVPESSGALVILNNPLVSLSIFIILISITIFVSFCKNKSSSYWIKFADKALLRNRIFGAFGFISSDRKRGADFRMYNQHHMLRYYMEYDKSFTVGGAMHKAAKGPMGAWSAGAAAMNSILIGIIYVFVCLKAWAGAFGVGGITQYIGSISALLKNMSMFIEAIGTLKNNVPFLRTTYEFLDIPNNMYQGSLTTEKRSDRKYNVEFKNVSFKYPGSERYALKNVNLKFNIGSRMAVVGENGSGKTTFIKLLCRLYDPTEGEILLNGIDIRKYRYGDYMKIFAVVFQDFQLISQSLASNVAGSSEYDSDRVKKSLIDAGFGQSLDKLENGLDTMLYNDFGEVGITPSGGEEQKIAIARALYKDAPFIILDEPTAALDPIAESEIYSKFNDIIMDKTAIYISHRLSSCKFCDEITVFEKGTVVQQGDHESLLSDTNGKYAELWDAQAQYYS